MGLKVWFCKLSTFLHIISKNRVRISDDRGFIQQKKLIELRLSNNKIFKVTNSTFDGLKTVTILSLRKNFIEELSAKVFSSLTSIEELDLGQNRIRSINAETFLGRDGKITIRFCHSDDYFKNNQQIDKVKENFVFDRKDEQDKRSL